MTIPKKRPMPADIQALIAPSTMSEEKKKAHIERAEMLEAATQILGPMVDAMQADVATAIAITAAEAIDDTYRKVLTFLSSLEVAPDSNSTWDRAIARVREHVENALKVNQEQQAATEAVVDEEEREASSRWFWQDDARDGWCGHFDTRQEAIDDAVDAGVEEIEIACFVPNQDPDDKFVYTVSPQHLILVDEDGVPLETPIERKAKTTPPN